MFDFLKMVLAVIVGMFIYDKSIELLNRNRLDMFYKNYDSNKRNKEWDESWEKKWKDEDDDQDDEF